MSPLVKNIIAVVVGILLGGIVNMGIILISGSIIPLPEGVNAADPESLKANMHLFESKHFLFPFLAHALGTLIGAFLTVRLAASRHKLLALLIGAVFMIGGIINVIDLPAPQWFEIIDLVAAYIPMGLLGWFLARKKN